MTSLKAGAAEVDAVSAQAAVLYCPDTGTVLYERNKDKRLSMASTTKIMTSLLAIESATPELNIIVSDSMLKVEGSSMGLLPGDNVSLRNLCFGMLLESGNDAANVTAIILGDTTAGFAKMMNDRAAEIGMTNTNFVTPSGLDDANHYSSAYDMSLLAAQAIKNKEFRRICSKASARISFGNPPYDRTVYNHNRLLGSYPGCFGIKTGFTKKSGRCLVTAAERNGVTLIAVTLNAPNDWADHKKMFDYGFSVTKSVELTADYTALSLRVAGGTALTVPLEAAFIPRAVFAGEIPKIENKIYIKQFEYAGVKKGSIAGFSRFFAGGKIIGEVPLIVSGDVNALPAPEKKKNILWEKIKSFFNRIFHRQQR